MTVIGVDPGKSGGIVILQDNKVKFFPMPIIDKSIDVVAINDILKEYKEALFVIEKVNAFNMGRQSAFNFGEGVGILIGIAVANKMRLHRVRPQEWQKHMLKGIPKTSSPKLRSLQAFKEQFTDLYNNEIKHLSKLKREGLIDAFFIALYGKTVILNGGLV